MHGKLRFSLKSPLLYPLQKVQGSSFCQTHPHNREALADDSCDGGMGVVRDFNVGHDSPRIWNVPVRNPLDELHVRVKEHHMEMLDGSNRLEAVPVAEPQHLVRSSRLKKSENTCAIGKIAEARKKDGSYLIRRDFSPESLIHVFVDGNPLLSRKVSSLRILP